MATSTAPPDRRALRAPGTAEPRVVLQSVWIFAVLSYLYCDVLTLMHADDLRNLLAGEVGGMRITEGFLFGAGVLMQIPIAMVLVSRFAPHRVARPACIVAGTVMTAVQALSLLVGNGPAAFYLLYSVIELSATTFVVWYAWRWRAES
jgi:MFS family permease